MGNTPTSDHHLVVELFVVLKILWTFNLLLFNLMFGFTGQNRKRKKNPDWTVLVLVSQITDHLF